MPNFSRPTVIRRIAGIAALAVALASPPVAASQGGSDEVARLYTEGQRQFDTGNFSGAAETWRKTLAALVESDDTRALRETVLINALAAYQEAYKADRDPAHLDEASALVAQYREVLTGTYGADAIPGAAVVEAEAALRTTARSATPVASKPAPSPTSSPAAPAATSSVATTPSKPLRPDRDGIGLITSGAVLLGAGAGVVPLLIIGLLGEKRAKEDWEQQAGDSLADSISQRSYNMQAMVITSAIAAPALIAAGAVMLGFGLNIRHTQYAVSPAVGPRFTGLSFRTRF